jgi:hypothetical protein
MAHYSEVGTGHATHLRVFDSTLSGKQFGKFMSVFDTNSVITGCYRRFGWRLSKAVTYLRIVSLFL